MPFTFTQIILTLFLLFALSRVILRFQGGIVSIIGLLFWGALFSSAIIFVLFPELTTGIAKSMGIGRGVDTIVYASIVILFYLVFRLYVYIQDIRQDITKIVGELAIRDALEKRDRKKSKD